MPATVPSSGYFTLKNDGDAPVTLTGLDSPAYGMAMLHETQTSGSTAKMVHVDAVELPAHGTVTFKPKSYHVMLEQRAPSRRREGAVPAAFRGRLDGVRDLRRQGADLRRPVTSTAPDRRRCT